MAMSRVEQKVFAIKKESVRGTAETVESGSRYLPLLPASEISPNPNLLQDTKIYGDPQERPPQGGIRQYSGTLELEPGTDKIGELLLSLLGTVTTDQPDAGGAPNVYRHRFTPLDSGLHPMHTLFLDRGVEQKKYSGLTCNQMTMNFPVDNRLAVSADVMAKAEAAGISLTPAFTGDLTTLLFSDMAVELAGSSSSIVRAASVVINNNAVEKRILNGSRDANDIVAALLEVTGTLQVYYEDGTERDKLIASLPSSLKLTGTGQIIEDDDAAAIEVDMPHVHYDAGPVSEVDGIQVIDFGFRATKRPTDPYQIQVELINGVVSY